MGWGKKDLSGRVGPSGKGSPTGRGRERESLSLRFKVRSVSFALFLPKG